jgi:proton glutamate symport protein
VLERGDLKETREKRGVGNITLVTGCLFYATGLLLATYAAHPGLMPTGLRLVGLAAFAWHALRMRSLTPWILWSMVAGVELGLDASGVALHLRVLSDVFLRMIKTIVAPLILGTLITGIAAHGGSRDVGRLGIKSLIYFEVLTTIALIVGLIAINISKAGVGLELALAGTQHIDQVSAVAQGSDPLAWDQFLLHVVPENLAKAVVENQILQVAFFAVFFGLALGQLNEERRRPLLDVIESLTQTMFRFTKLVMYFAPIGVGAAMAYTVAHVGVGVMIHLGKLVLTLYVALIVFVLIGLLPSALLARVPLRRFLQAALEPTTIGFATATSEAALPVAMERMEELGVPRRIVAFVIPTGYSFNLTGSALYLSLASIFVAQAGKVHMGWSEQLMMLLALMLTSKGVAGVPRAVIVVLLAMSSSFHLPTEPIILLLGVDAVMDMGRTATSVAGNCLASVVVAQWEGQFCLTPEGKSLVPENGESVVDLSLQE